MIPGRDRLMAEAPVDACGAAQAMDACGAGTTRRRVGGADRADGAGACPVSTPGWRSVGGCREGVWREITCRQIPCASRCGGFGRARLGRHRQRGFTLIEILLATVLLAAGLALAFATLRASTAVVERGEAMATRNDRMRAVEGFLRRRLAGALPMSFAVDPGSGQPLRFVGETDRIRFVADLPDYLGRGGPHLHDIAVFGDGDGRQLGVSFSMVLAGETVRVPQPRPPEPLARDLRDVRMRYRGFDEQGRLGEWVDQWGTPDILPLQVSIEITGAGGDAWPPMVVALPQSAGAPSGLFGGAGGAR